MTRRDPSVDQPGSLARNRDFVLLWCGGAVSAVGTRATMIAYPLLVLAVTGSPFIAGAVGFVATFPHVTLQIPAGVLVDRWDRKKVLVGADLGRLAAAVTVTIAVIGGRPATSLLIVTALVEGICAVFHNLAEQAAIRRVVPAERLPAAVSRNEARERSGDLLGQPVGGFLFGLFRWAPFAADALTYVVSIVTVLFIRADLRAERSASPANLAAEMTEGIRWISRHPFLRATSGLIAGSNLLFQAITLLVVVIARAHGTSSAVIGLIFAAAGVGGVLGSVAAPLVEKRVPMRTVVIGVNWVWAALVPFFFVAHSAAAIGAVLFLIAAAGPVWNVSVMAYQLRVVPEKLLARAAGAQGTVAFGAVSAGSLIGGGLLSGLGATWTTATLAGFMVVIAITASASPSIRRHHVQQSSTSDTGG